VIQKEILDPLSLEILDGHFGDGDKIQVGVEKGKLAFSKD